MTDGTRIGLADERAVSGVRPAHARPVNRRSFFLRAAAAPFSAGLVLVTTIALLVAVILARVVLGGDVP